MIAPALLRQIESNDLSAERVVAILDLASRYWMNGDRTEEQDVEIVIRLLERLPLYEEHLKGSKAIVHALARQAGLFPYFEPSGDLSDDIAYEVHRAPVLRVSTFMLDSGKFSHSLAAARTLFCPRPPASAKRF